MRTQTDWVVKFRDELPEEMRSDFEARIITLADQICEGNRQEAALVVSTWKNQAFYDVDLGIIKALEHFEERAPSIAKVKNTLKEAGYVTLCDHYDGTNLWVGKIVEGEQGYVEHTIRSACPPQKNTIWLERCLFVRQDSVKVGWGDGYHRSQSANDREISFDNLNELPGVIEIPNDEF